MNPELKKLNIPKLVALFLLLVIFAEWLPYFLEITLFFMIRDFGDIGLIDIFQIGGVFFTPIITFILVLISRKYRDAMVKISKIIMIVSLIMIIIFSWLYYLRFYQLWDLITALLPLSPLIEIIGFHADLDPSMTFLFLWINTIIFYILVPALIITATEGSGFLQFDINFDFAMLIGGFYLLLRPGSFAGVPYRFAVISNIIVAVILCSNVVLKPQARANEINIIYTLSNIPNGALLGTFMIIVFWFGVPGWLSNGYMFYSWTWIFLSIGVLLRWVLSRRVKNYDSKKVGGMVFIILFLMVQMVILSNIYTKFLPVLPIIIASGLGLVTCFIPTNKFIFSIDSEYSERHKFISHPIRFFFLLLFGLIGYLMPFLSCLLEPITVWATALLEFIFFIIPFIILLKFK